MESKFKEGLDGWNAIVSKINEAIAISIRKEPKLPNNRKGRNLAYIRMKNYHRKFIAKTSLEVPYTLKRDRKNPKDGLILSYPMLTASTRMIPVQYIVVDDIEDVNGR